MYEDFIPDENDAAPSDDQLTTVSELAQRQKDLEAQVAEQQDYLKSLEKQLRQVQEFDLPQAMEDAGLSEFKTKDGYRISIERKYAASIPAARREEAHQWLRENGYESVIKRNLTVQFGMGEDNVAGDIVGEMRQRLPDHKVTDEAGVHPQTLKKLVKECVEAGEDIPFEPFGVYVIDRAKVDTKK